MRELIGLLILSVLLSVQAHAIVLTPGKIESSLSKTDDGTEVAHITLRGHIAYPIADDLKEALSSIKSSAKIVLELDSQGGFTNVGEQIIEILENEINGGRALETFVRNGSKCGSMCVPIFMVAKTRRAGEVASFQFHPVTKLQVKVDKELTRQFLDKMISRGLSADWVEEKTKLGIFSQPGEYWITGKELTDQNSGIVTKLESRFIKYKIPDMPFDPDLRSR